MHDKDIKKLLKKLLNEIIQLNYNIFASVVLLVKKKKVTLRGNMLITNNSII